MAFKTPQELQSKKAVDKRTRVFEGPGSPVLNVKGLKVIESVRLNGVDLPLFIDEQFPLDTTLTSLHTIKKPLVLLSKDEDGNEILLRDSSSNNGVWQKSQTNIPCLIEVTGEWAEEEVEITPTASEAKGNTEDDEEEDENPSQETQGTPVELGDTVSFIKNNSLILGTVKNIDGTKLKIKRDDTGMIATVDVTNTKSQVTLVAKATKDSE
jgi:hypothetical protein